MPNRRMLLGSTLALFLAGGATRARAQEGTAVIAEGTNRRFSHTITTQADASRIWQLWMDVPGWKNWDKGLKDANVSAPLALGVRGQIIPLSGPAANFHVSAYEEGISYAFATALPLARLIVRRTIVGTNPTRFTHEVSFEGLLAGFWAGRFGPGFRQALPPTMAALAALAAQPA
jgi:hypothetical protein